MEIDNDLAVAEGVDPLKLSSVVFASTTGQIVSEVLKNNEKIEILVGVNTKSFLEEKSLKGSRLDVPSLEEQEFSIENILNLKVRSRFGQSVPIKTFIKKIVEKGPSSIQRLDGLRTVDTFW